MLPVEYGGDGVDGTLVASLSPLALATPTAAATVAGTRRRCRDLGLRLGSFFSFLSFLSLPLPLFLLSLNDTRFSEPDLEEPDRDLDLDCEPDLDLEVDLEREPVGVAAAASAAAAPAKDLFRFAFSGSTSFGE